MSSPLVGAWPPFLAASGFCSLVSPELAWLHLLSDLAIGLSYLSIPAVLLVVLLRRRDLAYPWLVGLFALFIVACGLTHLMHAWTLFSPAPVLDTLLKAITAAISVTVAVTLWPVLPRLLALRSPAALEREVMERRAAEERLGTFLANLAEAVFVVRVHPDGRLQIESVNPAFERMFSVPGEGLAGAAPETALPPPLAELALPRWRKVAEQGAPMEYEITADLPSGRLTWQTVLVPLRGADGRVERLLGSARDVTATRRLQAGLVQSARLATVGTMCAGLAHEASQPLNTASLWLRRARAAARGLPEAERAAFARAAAVVEDQLRRAGDLVARIRSLAGAEPEAAGRFDAKEPVAAAFRLAASEAAAEGITMTLRAADGPLPVQGSAGRLEQAMMNLLANARDAVIERRRNQPDAPASVEVALAQQSGSVVVEVRDSGVGIPEAVADAIFDPFFTTKDPGRGIGLGLPFAASAARAMGGRLEAWNRPGGGANFRLELPLADAGAVPAGAGAVPA
ncbi:PAS domain-containing sensor histidine kinase [Falsiroseomonas bella]|uniref:histidine kinase n=1 Tax=Falsiroseomonas bella TaxID=2184016 RepID=A0A317FHT1_9PROT|nr:ATP-binding protein [Falsiroseomonas bella]PWS37106.1 PAS domain-containing sensor histidine kinase [Falsiroseomonas bella]